MSNLVDSKPVKKPSDKPEVRAYVVVPNWNGQEDLKACLDSLAAQTQKHHLIVVDNGSHDGSVDFIKQYYPTVELIEHNTNKGYAGGVNPGFRLALERGIEYVAPFNNDAVADKQWLQKLVEQLDQHPHIGIATCKLLTEDGKRLDSTGDYYTNWGLPYPRGRGEFDKGQYDAKTSIFGASGGASLYRTAMLKQIGLLDEDFFAYYEDVDLSFRAQLAGWKVTFVPTALARHQIGGTSGKIQGFTTYQTLKNYPILWFKNTPRKYLWRIGWRLALAQTLFYGRALSRGQFGPAFKGSIMGKYLVLTGFTKRRQVQSLKTVSDDYIWQMIVHDLPPNANALRSLRAKWWNVRGKT